VKNRTILFALLLSTLVIARFATADAKEIEARAKAENREKTMPEPAAKELLARREQIGVKPKKSFAVIVRETPRLDGETFQAWQQRIVAEVEKYDTLAPTMLSEELLTRLSRRGKQPAWPCRRRARDVGLHR